MRNQTGSNNNNWKGDEASYQAKHTWVGRHKKKPKRCERCGKKTKELDKHSISGNYIREDLDDWIYVCMPCHIELNKQNKENKENNKCLNVWLEKKKEYCENNPDKVKAINKKWKKNNSDKVKAITKKHYEKHKEEIKEKAKENYQNNKEEILAKAKIRRENHKEEINARQRIARQNLSEEEREEINAKRRKNYSK